MRTPSTIGTGRSASAMGRKLWVVVAALVIVLMVNAPFLPQSWADPTPANGFNVTNVVWGTSAAPIEAGPGQQNVLLTVTLQYYFSNAASSVQATLTLPAGFTDINGQSTVSAFSSSNVPSGAVISLPFYLDLASGLGIGNYTFPMTITWGVTLYTQNSLSLIQYTQATVAVRGKAQLQFASNQPALAPGTVTRLPVLVSNTGNGPASNISLSFSPSSAGLPAVSIVSMPPQIALLGAGSTTTIELEVYAPITSVGSSVTFSVVASYNDAYGNPRSATSTVGAYVTSTAVSPVQVSAKSLVLTPGGVNNATLVVSNAGKTSLSQLVVSVSLPQSLSLLSQFPVTLAGLGAGASAQVPLLMFVPSTLAGSAISVPVTVSYTDSAGNQGVADQSVGFYVPALSTSFLSVGAVSLSLSPGSLNNVTLVISNGGTVALKQVDVGVSAPQMASVVGQFPKTIQGIPVGSSARLSLPLFVSSAAPGSPVTVVVTLSYTDAQGNEGTVTQDLGFYVPVDNSPHIGLSGYSYDPSLVYPGTTVAQLQVELVNSGTSPASDVNVTLLPSAPVYSISRGSLSRSIGLLPVGQTVPLSFMIGITNSSQALNSTLTVSVQSTVNGEAAKPLTFGIPFTEQPRANFEIVSVSGPSISVGDGADSIALDVKNTGSGEADFTTITILPSNVFQPSVPSSASPLLAVSYVNSSLGTLAAGASKNATYVIQVSSNVNAGTYPLSFVVSWRQAGSLTTFAKEVTVQVPVKATEIQVASSFIAGNGLIIGPVVVILLVLAVVSLRRRRAMRRAAKASGPPPAPAPPKGASG
jgi:hypothetical protein